MTDLERAFALIHEHPDQASFEGPRPKILVRAAEKALGLRLPPTYRRFVAELGAGNLGSAEIYGVIDADFERSSVPDAIWATLRAREDDCLPADLVILDEEDGELTCLQVRPEDEEGPVLRLYAGEDEDRRGSEVVAPDFGAYLLGRVEEALEAEHG
jgi:hypothetical protein